MTVTVWGDAGGPDTLAAHRNRYGELRSAHSYRELQLGLPENGIEIDADHDGQRLGQLLYTELGADERLRAVAVLDDDWLENVEQPVYFSPALDMRGDGIDRSEHYIARTAELIGLSLTLATARVGAHPLAWRQGDLRNPVDRHGWPCSWRGSDPLLARALDRIGTDWQARSRSATRIVDRRAAEVIPMGNGAFLIGDQLVSGNSRSNGRPAGAMRHGPPGRVLSVR
jgi:hypothetical protein